MVAGALAVTAAKVLRWKWLGMVVRTRKEELPWKPRSGSQGWEFCSPWLCQGSGLGPAGRTRAAGGQPWSTAFPGGFAAAAVEPGVHRGAPARQQCAGAAN